MFGWFRKPDKDQNIVGRMMSGLEHLMATHYKGVSDNFLRLLRDQIEEAFAREDRPPSEIVQALHHLFIESTNNLRYTMNADIEAAFSEWTDTFEPRSKQLWAQLVDQKIDVFLAELLADGTRILDAEAKRVKEADNRWMAKNLRR